jgi:MFS family permease
LTEKAIHLDRFSSLNTCYFFLSDYPYLGPEVSKGCRLFCSVYIQLRGVVKTKYFYGNNIVAASFVIQGMSIGSLVTYGVFFKEFQYEFGWSRTMISGASALNYLITGLGGILVGRLNDKIGPKMVITTTGIFLGLAFLLMSFLQEPWQLYLIYGVLAGIGISTTDIITLSTVARWFIKRRGMITGIVKMGTGFGQLVMPLIAAALISAYGWRHSYLYMAAANLVIILVAAQVLRRDPQGMGLRPNGDSHENLAASERTVESGVTLSAALEMKQFWIICMAWFTVFFCVLTIPVHIVPHARDLGLSPGTAAGVLSTIGGVSVLGRIVMGTANDRIGGKGSLILCYIVLLCGLIWLQVASNVWMLFLFAAIYGFVHGAFFTVLSPTVAEFFGTLSHGVLFGIILFSGTVGGSVGPLIAGRIFDTTGSYQIAFIVLTGMAAIGLALITLLKPLQKSDS